MSAVGQVLALVGSLFTLISALGVLRFPDVLARMHALTKASTLGFVMVAAGAAASLPTANDATSALLAAGLQILTLPVAANLIARSTYMAEGIPQRMDSVDELAQARRAGQAGVAREAKEEEEDEEGGSVEAGRPVAPRRPADQPPAGEGYSG